MADVFELVGEVGPPQIDLATYEQVCDEIASAEVDRGFGSQISRARETSAFGVEATTPVDRMRNTGRTVIAAALLD